MLFCFHVKAYIRLLRLGLTKKIILDIIKFCVYFSGLFLLHFHF